MRWSSLETTEATHTDAGETLLRLEGASSTVVLADSTDWERELELAGTEGTAGLYAQGSARLLIDDGLLAAA